MTDATYWAALGDPWRATGAAGWEDLGDVRQWLAGTGFTLDGRVLDIGCGTGRLSALCTDYTGVDITPPFVEYARSQGLNASVISGPGDLPGGLFDRVCLLSVFTHIPRDERVAYLASIRPRLTGEALIDILPGPDGGGVGAMYSDPDTFESDLAAAGFSIISSFDWDARSAHHRYYRIQ